MRGAAVAADALANGDLILRCHLVGVSQGSGFDQPSWRKTCGAAGMYVSRLSFSTVPGKGHIATDELHKLAQIISSNTGARPRILRTHFGSLGEADLQIEQEVGSMGELEDQLRKVTGNPEFRTWSDGFSKLLLRSPQREIMEVVD
jgi:hypothetical protein